MSLCEKPLFSLMASTYTIPLIMEKWGNCMEEKAEKRSDKKSDVFVPDDEHSQASP